MRKKLFAILMSAMMMVTFMPAMAFADTPEFLGTATAITWSGDTASVTYKDREGIYTFTKTAEVETWNLNFDDGVVGYKVVEHNDRVFTEDGFVSIKGLDTEKNSLTHKVLDLKNGAWTIDCVDDQDAATYAMLQAQGKTPAEVSVKAQDYKKSTKSTLKAADYVITYPEYKAFNYVAKGTTAKDFHDNSLHGKITVVPSDAWKAYHTDVEIVGVAEKEIQFKVNGLGTDDAVRAYWTEWSMTGVAADKNGNVPRTFTYDGKDHSPALNHPAEATTVTYACKPAKATATGFEFDEVKAADFTADAPVLKNAGKYLVAVKTTLNMLNPDDKTARDSETVYHIVTINQKAITKFAVKGDQVALAKNYDGKGFAIDASMFDIVGLCDGDALVFPAKETGANVGIYNLTPEIAKLAVLNPNYSFNALQYVTGSAVGTILKADNDCGIKLNSKTVKASALKKAAKKYDVKAYATFGTAKVAKVSGSSKLSISGGQLKIKKGTKKGTYKIQVKVTAAGTANYAEATAFETIKITVK